MPELMEYRVRSKISEDELSKKVGRIIKDEDYNMVLTGPTRMMLPNGEPLCVYLPGIIPQTLRDLAYPILTTIRIPSNSRSYASGSRPVELIRQVVYRDVMSTIIGNIEPMGGGRFPYCRTTAWSGQNTEQFTDLYPLFEEISQLFKEYVPDRFQNQLKQSIAMNQEWRIGTTPYTTMTVNNTYPTGVHKDKGDLQQGFSCLMTLRRGDYTGGNLVFPEYRVSVNMGDGDLILMDAHQWHGNTEIIQNDAESERISLVLYYRTKMVNCGSREEEIVRKNYKLAKPIHEYPLAAQSAAKKPETDYELEQELEAEFIAKGSISE